MGGICNNDLAADSIIAEYGLDSADAFSDRLLFIESGEDDRYIGCIAGSRGIHHELSLKDFFVIR
jgi:hypothetical protein